MVIGFNKQFVEPILNGTKIHTIREDKNHRWQKGMKMHMATGVRTKQYKQFAEKVCTGNRRIEIEPYTKTVKMTFNSTEVRLMNDKGIELLAKNDGFKTVQDFWKWFDKPFIGKLIYWVKEPY